MKQAIIVLGMHRSGTSSVAGTLALLGASAPRTLMPEHPDNPKGYWESATLVALNERILASAGSTWSDWRALNPEWSTSAIAESLMSELGDLIPQEFGEAPLIVLKDPRICRLYPFWERVLRDQGYRVGVMMPLRSPGEIAGSLHKRDGFSAERSLLIWLRHVLEAERSTREVPRFLFQWSDFVADWRQQIDLASKALATPFPARSNLTAAQVDTFLDGGMRRNLNAERVPPQALDWVEQVDRVLGQMVDRPDDLTLHRVLDDIHHMFNETAQIYAPALAGLEVELASLSRSSALRIEEVVTERNIALHDKQWLLNEVEARTQAFEQRIAALSHGAAPGSISAPCEEVSAETVKGDRQASDSRIEVRKAQEDLAKATGRILELEAAIEEIKRVHKSNLATAVERSAAFQKRTQEREAELEMSIASAQSERDRLEDALAVCSANLTLAETGRQTAETLLSDAQSEYGKAAAVSKQKIESIEQLIAETTAETTRMLLDSETRADALRLELAQRSEAFDALKSAYETLRGAIKRAPIKTAVRILSRRTPD